MLFNSRFFAKFTKGKYGWASVMPEPGIHSLADLREKAYAVDPLKIEGYIYCARVEGGSIFLRYKVSSRQAVAMKYLSDFNDEVSTK